MLEKIAMPVLLLVTLLVVVAGLWLEHNAEQNATNRKAKEARDRPRSRGSHR